MTEDLNIFILCFGVAAIDASIIGHEDAGLLTIFAIGFVIVAVGLRLVAWMEDKYFQITGG